MLVDMKNNGFIFFQTTRGFSSDKKTLTPNLKKIAYKQLEDAFRDEKKWVIGPKQTTRGFSRI